jgi:hypothetical protein
MDKMNWIDEREAQTKEGEYFNMQEGDNRFQLLTHCAPQPLKWTGTKYEPAEEGDTNISIKGVCWVLQDEKIKLAQLPYTVVKAIRALQNDPDYTFEEFPMPRLINVKAKGAGTKEVEYSVIPAPKEVSVSKEVMEELAKKPTPEEMVEKMKGKKADKPFEYPERADDINPADTPF